MTADEDTQLTAVPSHSEFETSVNRPYFIVSVAPVMTKATLIDHQTLVDLSSLSAFSDSRAVQVARVQIDKDVRILTAQAHALRLRSNELALVSRLPSELLSDIFIDLRNIFAHEQLTDYFAD